MISSIKFIKLIDKTIGPFLLRLLPGTVKKNISQKKYPQKIVVIRPGGMGDALLLLPVLKKIYTQFAVNIDILCEPRNESVFRSVFFINEIFSYKNPAPMLAVLQKKYDAVFDTEQSHLLTAVLTRLLHAQLKIGFKTEGREKMYCHSVPYSHSTYEAESFWQLFSEAFNLNAPFHFDFPYFSPLENPLPFIKEKDDIVCFFPGATIRERLWPEKRWAEVIDWAAEKKMKPVLIGGKQERKICEKILGFTRSREILNLCGQLSIAQTAELFKHTKLLVSTDSGILHLGVLCNVKTISLFGSGIAAKWAPKGNNHFIINRNLACSPCTRFGTTPPCPINNSCMLQITPEDVIRRINLSLPQMRICFDYNENNN